MSLGQQQPCTREKSVGLWQVDAGHMHPALWGPFVWALLHALVHVPPTAAQADLMARFLRHLQQVLPCTVCQTSFNLILEDEMGRMRAAVLEGKYLDWVYGVHVRVTHKILKEQYVEAGVLDPDVQASLLAAHDASTISLQEVQAGTSTATCTQHTLFMVVAVVLYCARTVRARRCALGFVQALAEVLKTASQVPSSLTETAGPLGELASSFATDPALRRLDVKTTLLQFGTILLPPDSCEADAAAVFRHLVATEQAAASCK